MLTIVSGKYLRNLEKELDYWRARADAERERADRIQDQLMAVNGYEPATETVRVAHQELNEKAEQDRAEQMRQMQEMFAESIEDAESGGLELPSELQGLAKQMMK